MKKSIMKRVAMMMSALVLLPVLSACTPAAPSTTAAGTSAGTTTAGTTAGTTTAGATTTASGEQVVIDFFHRWPNEPRKSFYDAKVKEYMDAHPNVKINVDAVLNDAYKEKIRVLVSSDDLPDIFTSWSDSFALNLVSSERILPLEDALKADTAWAGSFLESQFPGFTFDNVRWGVPFTIDGKAFFYNKAIFTENGLTPPATYEEFITVLDKLKAAGYEAPLVEGLTNAWAVSHYQGTILQRIMDPAVTAVDYEATTGEFTDPGYVKALEIFQQLTGYMGEISTAIDHETARNMFASGEAPIVYMQFAEIKMVEDNGDIEFGFFNFPTIEGGKGDQKALTGAPEGWMISKNAPPETLDFLKFLTSAETAAAFTKADGQLNAIKGAVTEDNTSPARKEAYDIVLGASEAAPWFDNAVNINIADIFMRGGQSLATGETTPADIMKDVQEEAARLRK